MKKKLNFEIDYLNKRKKFLEAVTPSFSTYNNDTHGLYSDSFTTCTDSTSFYVPRKFHNSIASDCTHNKKGASNDSYARTPKLSFSNETTLSDGQPSDKIQQEDQRKR